MDKIVPAGELNKAKRRYLVRKGVILGRPLVGPLEVAVIPTYKCHYRCIFCALESEAPAKKPDMPVETLHGLIDDLADLNTEQISYTGGGEPFLYKGIDELIAHTREKGIAASVCTNGERLNQERIETFARLGVHLSISINAATPDLYAKIHPGTKPGTFERIVENLTEYVQIARREGGEGSFVSLNFVLMNMNCHQVPEMAELGRRIGASQIQFRHIQPRLVHKHLVMNEQQLNDTRKAIRDVELKYKDVENFTIQVMEILRATEGVSAVEPSDACCNMSDVDSSDEDLVNVPCIEGYIASYVDADGVVFPCCMRSTSITNHWMGTLAEKRFSDIWFSEDYQGFRRQAMGITREDESADENSCRFCPKAKQFVYTIDEMGPGNYAHLYRELAADLKNQVDQRNVQDGQSGKSVLAGVDCQVGFVDHDMPVSVKAGDWFTINVAVCNASTKPWPSVNNWNAVGLGFHLLSRWRRLIQFDNNPRTYLSKDLEPGQVATLPLQIKAPDKPGKYVVELAMIQENVAWFETHGGSTMRVSMKVIRS